MTRSEYILLQAEVSALMDSYRLLYKHISGKRREGYEMAILAVKSMLSSKFKPINNRVEIDPVKPIEIEGDSNGGE